MSTRINVTVGDGGLLDRNAQQTAANRQARVLADQRATAEAEGVERRAADRTAAGLDPLTGLPASTPSSASTINRLNQEPAANRTGTDIWSMYFRTIPEFFNAALLSSESSIAVPTRWSATDFLYKNKRIVPAQPFALREFGLAEGTPNPFKFFVGVAPGGTNAISAPRPTLGAIPSFTLFPGTVLPSVVVDSVPFKSASFSATLECDVKLENASGTFVVGITFYGRDGSTKLFAKYTVRLGLFANFGTTTDQGAQTDTIPPNLVPLNTWTRIAFVVNRTYLKVFVDGQLKSQVLNPIESSLQNAGLATFDFSASETQVNGLLVTRKPLYFSNYTPQFLRF
jgi:hypothetical protein